jgi:hypothetical protein
MYCNQLSTVPLPRELLESVLRYAADVMVGGKTFEQRRTGVNNSFALPILNLTDAL